MTKKKLMAFVATQEGCNGAADENSCYLESSGTREKALEGDNLQWKKFW